MHPSHDFYPDAAAEVLLYNRKVVMYAKDKAYILDQVHNVMQLHTEGGLDFAEVRLNLWSNAEIVQFAARTINADGSVYLVDEDGLYETNGRTDDETFRVISFRFPQVEPGSVIEYIVTTNTEGYRTGFSETISESVPIRKYRLDIQGTDNIHYVLDAFNVGAKIQKSMLGESWRLNLNLEDIPGYETESFSPHWSLGQPNWRFRTTKIEWGRGYESVPQRSWAAVLKGVLRRIFDDEDKWVGEGLPAQNFKDLPNSRNGKVESLLAHLHSQLEFKDRGSFWGSRTLSEVVEDSKATGTEMNLLLFYWLEQEGIGAQLAFAARKNSQRFDAKKPDSGALNHVLLYLPAEDGEEALWLDAGCEHCSIGQVPRSLEGVDAVIGWKDGNTFHAELRAVDAPVEPRGVTNRLTSATLLADGRVAAKVKAEWLYQSASGQHAAGIESSPAVRRTEQEDRLRGQLPSAIHSGDLLPSCVPEEGVCSQSFELTDEHYALSDGDRMIVPLSLMSSWWDDAFKERERLQDIAFLNDEDIVETLLFELPEGSTIVSLPTEQDLRVDGLHMTLHTESAAGRVTITRTLSVEDGIYDVERYDELRDVVRKFADVRSQLLVVRQSAPGEQSQPAAESIREVLTPE